MKEYFWFSFNALKNSFWFKIWLATVAFCIGHSLYFLGLLFYFQYCLVSDSTSPINIYFHFLSNIFEKKFMLSFSFEFFSSHVLFFVFSFIFNFIFESFPCCSLFFFGLSLTLFRPTYFSFLFSFFNSLLFF